MEAYKTRKIRFKSLIRSDDWHIKVYTISKVGNFDNETFYKNIIKKLPEWLKLDNGFNSSNDKVGFLILHAGTEGIFSLLNWWVGKNMLNTHIFLTDYEKLTQFEKISGKGLSPCIWELEIINHERVSWTANILKLNTPNFNNYLSDTINIEI